MAIQVENYKLLLGDSLDMMNIMRPDTIDSIVCDPPYGLSFMGKNWDHGVPGVPYWKAALRVAKPGAHLLAFGGTRTHHRLMSAIEDAGWELRDVCMWVYSSGFPKSLNVSKEMDKLQGVEPTVIERTGQRCGMFAHSGSGTPQDITDYEKVITEPTSDLAKQWDGWGSALKPAWEPIILARKPLSEKNISLNILRWGTGALNIGASRIEGDSWKRSAGGTTTPYSSATTWNTSNTPRIERGAEGRWPANFLFDEALDEQWAKYFYCSKAQKKDRDEGLDSLSDSKRFSKINKSNGTGERFDGSPTPIAKNTHPTVKPTDLMRYLCRMITPPNGLVLDPFMGSGSTGKAAILEGYEFIGIDIEQDYLKLAELRIEHALRHKDN